MKCASIGTEYRSRDIAIGDAGVGSTTTTEIPNGYRLVVIRGREGGQVGQSLTRGIREGYIRCG